MKNMLRIVKGYKTAEKRGEHFQGIVERERERDGMFTVNKDRPTGFVGIYS